MRVRLPALLLLCVAATVHAAPRISIIIDDMGNNYRYGREAIDLPGTLTYSFLPDTPYAARFARAAHAEGREVMLHLPMEAESERRLGPGGITLQMSEAQFRATVRADLASIPFVSGVNNHMGSLLTQNTPHMDWLMSELNAHGGLYFVDSVTTRRTVAAKVALQYGLPTTRRDFFLDDDPDPDVIRRQLARAFAAAYRHGTALAIAHPHPTTLRVLAEVLPRLREIGVELVPVSQLIDVRLQRSPRLWQASLSPSLQVAKSSKR